MWAFWVFLAITLALHFGIPLVSKKFGPAVQARFVERLKAIPGPPPVLPLNLPNLQSWIAENPASAYGYACPVLFPLDFLFMFALAGTAALGSMLAARHATYVSSWPWWLWCILPGIYLAADFIEDVLLVGFLRNPASLNAAGYGALSFATSIKIKSAIAAIGVMTILGISASVNIYEFVPAI